MSVCSQLRSLWSWRPSWHTKELALQILALVFLLALFGHFAFALLGLAIGF